MATEKQQTNYAKPEVFASGIERCSRVLKPDIADENGLPMHKLLRGLLLDAPEDLLAMLGHASLFLLFGLVTIRALHGAVLLNGCRQPPRGQSQDAGVGSQLFWLGGWVFSIALLGRRFGGVGVAPLLL